MKSYVIYKVTDLTNNKIYIGKTNHYEVRKIEHTKYEINNGTLFHRALKAHGLDNFKWEIIDHADTLDEINNLEIYYIDKFNTLKPNGYNMTKGGDGGNMYQAVPVVCLTLDGDYVDRYESAMEAKRKGGFHNSTVIECCKGKAYTCKGHQFMYEKDYLKYGGKKYAKPKNKCEKKVYQCDINGELLNKFDSITKASLYTNSSRTAIVGCLKHRYKTANGFVFVYEDEYPINDLSKHKQNKKGKKIVQLDKDTLEVIEKFDRVTDAANKLDVNYKPIHRVVDKPGRTAYGYIWKSQ